MDRAADDDDQNWKQFLELDDYDGDDGSAPTQQLSESCLVGFVIVNIVGLRYYTGRINGREMVGLVREPLNSYDPNAIKVLNTRSLQVGHIEKSAAAALAPLIDSRLITVEGIVPKPPKSLNPYRLPCQVHIFALPHAFPTVRSAIAGAGLHLISQSDAEFPLSQSALVQEAEASKKKENKNERGVDEIFALVGKGSDTLPPVELNKEVIVTELFEHQKEGLGWLISRENSDDLPPFWEVRDGGFLNLLTNHLTNERPEPLRGGIFADDMGLGKTLTLISLVATNGIGAVRPSPASSGASSGTSGGRRSKSGKKAVNPRKKRKIDDGQSSLCDQAQHTRTTLVVCPSSVLSTWVTQLEQHTRRDSLKVYLYHGERTREADELVKYDMVLTTYKTLASEFDTSNSPLQNIEWLRVIIDEAHMIKNFAAMQTKAVIALRAERRWVVTGTPIQNSSFDLFSLMAFLRFQPFSLKYYWQTLVQRPLVRANKIGLLRLQALMRSISLRRLKDMLNSSETLVALLPKTIETCLVDLSFEERENYDQMELEAQNTVREYINADTVLRNYSTVLHILLRLRQICNDIALCPSDIKSFLSSTSTIEDVSNNPDLLRKLGAMIEDGDDFDCPVCLCPPNRAVITRCTHIFCQPCILKTLKHLKPCCPICRGALTQSDLFLAPPPKPSDEDSVAASSDRPISSKVSTLIKLLQASKSENPSVKSVVFSQFRKMLILLEQPLRDAGFKILRLDGSMTMKNRTKVMKEFESTDPGAPDVLLASLKAAGTGINLTAASRVYLVEPWWNPAAEEQAMDRVHRIGQKEEVKVVRLIVRNSIEERILELQEKKKKLAGGVFCGKAAKEQKQMRVEDIRRMMGM